MQAAESVAIKTTGVDRMLQEEFVLPCQTASGPRVSEGERRLMLAVLEDAIRCFTGEGRLDQQDKHSTAENRRRRLRLQTEAREWFTSGDESHLYTFLSCCFHLGVDAGRLRQALFSGQLTAVRLVTTPACHKALGDTYFAQRRLAG